jgi:hypothetical protein
LARSARSRSSSLRSSVSTGAEDVLGGGWEVELFGDIRRPVRKEKREGREVGPPAVAGRGSSFDCREVSSASEV